MALPDAGSRTPLAMLENESNENNNEFVASEPWSFEEAASAAPWPSEPARVSRLCARARSAASPLELVDRIREHSSDLLPCQEVLVLLGAAFDLRLVEEPGQGATAARPAYAQWLMQASQSLVGQAGMTHRLGARNLPASLRDGWPAEWPPHIHAYRLQDRLGRANGLVVYVPSAEWPPSADMVLEALHHLYGASLEVAATLQAGQRSKDSLARRLLSRLGLR
jgi:hypothetical protein